MAKSAIVSCISIPNSTVRSKTSVLSVSKPNTKLPQVEMPCSWSISITSRYCEGRFWRLPVNLTVSSSMLSKPMKSALHPLSAISFTFSIRLTAASEHCPIQCFLSGIIRVNRSSASLRTTASACSSASSGRTQAAAMLMPTRSTSWLSSAPAARLRLRWGTVDAAAAMGDGAFLHG
jgi:hypothetical protein